MRSGAAAEVRILLSAFFAVAVALQAVVIPWLAADAASRFPEVAYLQTPLTVLAVLAIACGQAALLCIWQLVSGAGRGASPTRRTLRWTDGLILALVAGTGILAAVAAVLARDPQTGGGGPVVGLGLMAGMFLGAAAVLGLMVWRARLVQSIRGSKVR